MPDGGEAAGLAQRHPANVFHPIEQLGCTVTVRRRREIYGHDEPADFCWRLISGCARTVIMLADGRRHVGTFLLPGDLLGLHDLNSHDSDAEAVTDSILRRYPRRAVDAQAGNDPGFALGLRAAMMGSLRCAHRQIVLLGRMTAVERIANFLLELGQRTAPLDALFVELPMSRTDIADHLGLSIETVCRNLALLQREGAVAIRRTGIALCDRAALLDFASTPQEK
jgi:CRP/FNR family nitrogen fixation transcriptional regulator